MGHDVFISYASADRETADATCRTLEERGLSCWIAPRDILPGQDYGEAIIDGIQGSRLFVLIFSAAANQSHQVRREVERAASRDITIIPFRIEEVAPAKALEYFISSAHWLNATGGPRQPRLDYLADVAAQLARGEKPPAPPGAPKRVPLRRWRSPAVVAAALAGVIVAGAYLAWPQSGRVRPNEPPLARDQLKMKLHFPSEAERLAARSRAVPDVSRTIFTRRAVPVRSDKPLRLRDGPSETARPIAVIGPDEVFRIAPRQGEWWPARLRDGTEGYVQGRWVNVLDQAGGNAGR